MRDVQAVQKMSMQLPEVSANGPDAAVEKICFSDGIRVVFVNWKWEWLMFVMW